MYTEQRANPTPDFTPHCTPKSAESEVKHVVDAPDLAARQPGEVARGRINVPSDPNVRCTLDELLSIFGGAHRLDAERDLLRKLREKRGHEDVA